MGTGAGAGAAVVGLAALAVLAPAGTVEAQEGPPPPLPRTDVTLPPFQERALPGGARLLVVTQHEMPFVTVNLVLPAGRTEDPPGQVGLAGLTAGLLTRGTTSRSADSIADAVRALGAELHAEASQDWTTVSASAVTSDLPAVLALMADVVLHPTFPGAELEALRSRTLSALRASLTAPATLADRQFLRTVYGDHPYGRLETLESLEAVDRASVVAFHRTRYRPDRALFVVAGDADADRAEALLREAFQGWEASPPPTVAYGAPPEGGGPRIVLVHRPGTTRVSIRVGGLLPGGDDPDWTTLSVVNQILGGAPEGRLLRTLREAGLPGEAYSEVQRRLDRGFFRVSAETSLEAAGPVLEELLARIAGMGTGTVGPRELREAREFLVGSYPLQMETPQQVASPLTTAHLLGVPDTAVATYPRRVAGIGPGDLREAARAHLRPDDLVYVVVGDASRLHGVLTTFGEVRVVDDRGEAMDALSLLPRGRSEPLDASALRPVTLEYRVTWEGRTVGTVRRRLEEGGRPGTMVYRGEADMGPQTAAQSVTFTVPDFEAVAARARAESMGGSLTMEVEVREGRIVGSVGGSGGSRELDQPLPSGAVLGDMVELVVWIADLEPGRELTVPDVRPETGAVENIPYRVEGTEEVTVPAGTFRAYRVEIGGSQAETVWARVEAPHVLLRIEPSDQPVVLELTSLLPAAREDPGSGRNGRGPAGRHGPGPAL